jgi:hypothetical protein
MSDVVYFEVEIYLHPTSLSFSIVLVNHVSFGDILQINRAMSTKGSNDVRNSQKSFMFNVASLSVTRQARLTRLTRDSFLHGFGGSQTIQVRPFEKDN